MSEEYQRITKILVWIVSISMIAYFVITPFTYFRQTPPKVSPGSQEITPTTTGIIPVQSDTNFSTSVPLNLAPIETQTETQSENLPIQ